MHELKPARPSLTLALVLVAAAALTPPRHARSQQPPRPAPPHPAPEERRQPQPQPTPPAQDEAIRIDTELVQAAVTVLDGKGQFVDGLRPEQFELRVDGRAAAVSFFERVSAGTGERDLSTDGLEDFARLPYAAEVGLEGQPAGRYLLRVTAVDRAASASAARQVKFEIR